MGDIYGNNGGLIMLWHKQKKWGSRQQPLGTLLMRIYLLWSLTCRKMRWRIAYGEFEPTVFSKLPIICSAVWVAQENYLVGAVLPKSKLTHSVQLLVSSVEAFSIYLGLNPQVFVYIAYVSSQTYLTFFSVSSGI